MEPVKEKKKMEASLKRWVGRSAHPCCSARPHPAWVGMEMSVAGKVHGKEVKGR